MTEFSRQFEEAFTHTLGIESEEFTDDPDDHPTRYGIIKSVWRANGYMGDLRDATLPDAKLIAKLQYWDTLRLDDVAEISSLLPRELFDTGFNMGVGKSGQFLQKALNTFNNRGKHYQDVAVDGVIGPVTLFCLKAYLDKRGRQGEQVMYSALNSQQGARYIDISEYDEVKEKYTYGWFQKRVYELYM